jgi:acyl-coenzyme A thioesterase PaaI-like protein
MASKPTRIATATDSTAAMMISSTTDVTKKNGTVTAAVRIKPATAMSHGRERSGRD